MDSLTLMMVFMNLAFGVYLLYSAIRGKGSLYDNTHPDYAKPMVHKMLRVYAWILGSFLTVLSAVTLINPFGNEAARMWILTGGLILSVLSIFGFPLVLSLRVRSLKKKHEK